MFAKTSIVPRVRATDTQLRDQEVGTVDGTVTKTEWWALCRRFGLVEAFYYCAARGLRVEQ